MAKSTKKAEHGSDRVYRRLFYQLKRVVGVLESSCAIRPVLCQ